MKRIIRLTLKKFYSFQLRRELYCYEHLQYAAPKHKQRPHQFSLTVSDLRLSFVNMFLVSRPVENMTKESINKVMLTDLI